LAITKPTVSIIVSIYNDLEALTLVINSLLNQSHIADEIIITEDAEHDYIKKYISDLNNNKIIHLSQEDKGWRKEKALNSAIRISSSEYLIFIDGDCIPFKHFIKSHLELSQEKHALCGRRTEPGINISKKLKNKELSISDLEENYFKYYNEMIQDKVRHYEEGIYLKTDSMILKLINKFRKKNNHIVGCNWSCYKRDLELINGYDEDFTLPTNGEDTDIERRLRYFDIKIKSCRNSANVFHLYHEKNFNANITQQTKALMDTKKDIFVCNNGLQNLKI